MKTSQTEQESERMRSFLESLIDDPKLRDEFRRDPDSVLARTDLSEGSRKALFSRDPKTIRDYVKSLLEQEGEAIQGWYYIFIEK